MGILQGLSTEQSLSQKQKHALAPSLYQSMNILALGSKELAELIENTLESNLVLQKVDANELGADSEKLGEVSLDKLGDRYSSADYGAEDYSNDYGDYGDYAGDYAASDAKSPDQVMEATLEGAMYLSDYMSSQLGMLELSPKVEEVCKILVQNLDDRGFWIESPETLMEAALYPPPSPRLLKEAIRTIQALDPIGCGTKNEEESLHVQVALAGYDKLTQAALDELIGLVFVSQTRDDLPYRIGDFDTSELISLLAHHEPHPGSGYLGGSSTQYIYPDIIVRKLEEGDDTRSSALSDEETELDEQGTEAYAQDAQESTAATKAEELNKRERAAHEQGYRIQVGSEIIPEIKIDEDYTSKEQKKELSEFWKEQLQDARSFIDALDRRNRSLKELALHLLEVQQDFFAFGPAYIKSCTQREMAEKMSVHETTVSRLVREKYIDTPWGVFPLQKLFPAPVGHGEKASKNRILASIRDIRLQEQHTGKKLTDEKIRKELEARGFRIARRTVAKYRKELDA